MTEGYTVDVAVGIMFELPEMPLEMAHKVGAELAAALREAPFAVKPSKFTVTSIKIYPIGTKPPEDIIDLNAIRARMRELGLRSSREVSTRARDAGDPLSHTTINAILQGVNRVPGARARRGLARALEMPEDWLF